MNLWILAWICAIWITDVLGLKYRLPTDLKPEHYDLELITHIEGDDMFSTGKVVIRVNCLNATNQIILHSTNLTIFKEKLSVDDKAEQIQIPVTEVEIEDETEFLKITVAEPLKVNRNYHVHIVFEAKIDDSLFGYYKSSYQNTTTNATEWMAVTQFEATYARKAFPCFDEPGMKAKFKIRLGRPSDYSTLSNMPLIQSEPIISQPGMVMDFYEETPLMSTYLIAFATSKFAYRDAVPSPNVPKLRVYARKDAVIHTDFANKVGSQALAFYQDYFKINFVLPKMDMIAVPDFYMGAMENWGLVTYRESLLTYDKKVNSQVNKYNIANIICHELAHQWFGNLVTMKWWSDVWLNEGFATKMAATATEAIFPEWNALEIDSVMNVLFVLRLDSLKSSHQISIPVEDPREISEIFDIISYKKGAFLLRMVTYFLGEETFKNGLTKYLNQHAFQNAAQNDLWHAWTEQAHHDNSLDNNTNVKQIMDTWTLQTGYPVLNVVRNYNDNTAVITQERFLLDSEPVTANGKSCWWVPITFMTEENTNLTNLQPKKWLSCPSAVETIPDLPKDDKWLLMNINISALCRINYDANNWKLLIRTLRSSDFEKIPPLNRIQLIDDSAALAWTGKLDYDVHFNILRYLIREKKYLPWRAAVSNFETLDKLFRKTPSFGLLKAFIKRLLTRIFNEVGGPKEGDLSMEETSLRTIVSLWACKYGVGNCVSNSTALFQQYLADPTNNPIPKDLRFVYYCSGIRNGNENDWNALWKQYQESPRPSEQSLILSSLACTRKVWLINRYLEWAITSNSGIRKQDVGVVFRSVADSDVGYYVYKEFLFKNIHKISIYLDSATKRIAQSFKTVAEQIINRYELNEFKAFVTVNREILQDSAQVIKQAIETAAVQVEWHRKHYAVVTKILEKIKKSEFQLQRKRKYYAVVSKILEKLDKGEIQVQRDRQYYGVVTKLLQKFHK